MQTIYLDISNKGVVPTIYAKQGDIGRKIQVIFMDSGIPYQIPENARLSVWYDGDSGDGNYTDIGDNSAIVVENNKVTFELIVQMLNNDGEGIVCLIMNVGEEQIGSWNIHYLCEKIPGFNSEGASSYFTAFSESVNKLKDIDKTLTKEGYPADAKATGDRIDDLTAADVGAAPSGYGLGGSGAWAEDLNNATGSGFWAWQSTALNRPFDYGTLLVLNRGDSKVTQIAIDPNMSWCGQMAVRHGWGSSWSEWEYINPPMSLGVEYPTVERYRGKRVYTKAIDFGSMPNASVKSANHNIANLGAVISAVGTTSDGSRFGYYLPLYNNNAVNGQVGIYVTQGAIQVSTTADWSSYNATIILKYTKTTD